MYPTLSDLAVTYTYICLFVWDFTSHSRIFNHMDTSTLTVKGFKFRPILGTLSYWAMRVLRCDTSAMKHETSVYFGHIWGSSTCTHDAERVAVVCRGLDSNSQPSAFEANALINIATTAARWRFFFVMLQFEEGRCLTRGRLIRYQKLTSFRCWYVTILYRTLQWFSTLSVDNLKRIFNIMYFIIWLNNSKLTDWLKSIIYNLY